MSPMPVKILPTITTTSRKPGIDWRSLIAEANQLGLTEICFFPTDIPRPERDEAYRLLEQSSIRHIPFVHLRSDMGSDEIEYLASQFGTTLFNLHSEHQYPLTHDLSTWKTKIYLETQTLFFDTSELIYYAGICPDFSHLEHFRLSRPDLYESHLALMRKKVLGCGHISAWRKDDPDWEDNPHQMKSLSDLDYLPFYREFFPPLMALELENTIAEQLEAKAYLEEKLTGAV
jgi:hypothetical protein